MAKTVDDFLYVYRFYEPAGRYGERCKVVHSNVRHDRFGDPCLQDGGRRCVVEFTDGASMPVARSAMVRVDSVPGRQVLAKAVKLKALLAKQQLERRLLPAEHPLSVHHRSKAS